MTELSAEDAPTATEPTEPIRTEPTEPIQTDGTGATGASVELAPDTPLAVLGIPAAAELPGIATADPAALPALAEPDLPQLAEPDLPQLATPDLPQLAEPDLPQRAEPEMPAPVPAPLPTTETVVVAVAAPVPAPPRPGPPPARPTPAGISARVHPHPRTAPEAPPAPTSPPEEASPPEGASLPEGATVPGATTTPAVPVVSAKLPASPETAADVPVSDPSAWGRVDADGTVWLRTAGGERPVGSFPGVAGVDALAYFGRKYDELVGQVMLLEQRVSGTDLAPKEALGAIGKLVSAVGGAAAVGDLLGLLDRLDALVPVVEARKAAADEARARRRTESRGAKDRIIAEADELAQSSEWKRAGDRLRDLLEEWKKVPRLERAVDDDLWKAFSTARSTFDKRRRQHFSALDTQREESHARKERLIAEAESLADSTDWGPTGSRLRELMTEWKAAGRARRDLEDELWDRFRAAQDRFFAARNAVFGERDAELRANAEKKTALLVEVEAILPVRDLGAAKAALRRVQEQWEEVGHVPRDAREQIEGRLRRVEQAVREGEETTWKRSNPEARARAQDAVTQLQSSIAKLGADAAKARARGDERKAAQAGEAAAARESWLVEAQKTLADLS